MQPHLEFRLLLELSLKFLSRFLKLLLLKLLHLGSLLSDHHLLFHLFQTLQHLLFLPLGFLLCFLFFSQFFNQSFLFSLLDRCILLNCFPFSLCTSEHFSTFLLKLLFELSHSFLVVFSVPVDLSPDYSMVRHDLAWVSTLIQLCELLFESFQLFLVFTEKRVFGVFIDPGLVLYVLSPTSIS